MAELMAVGGYLAVVSTIVWLIGVMTGGDGPPQRNARDGYEVPGIDETTGGA